MIQGSKSGHLDPFWGFTLKTVPRIHDPRISLLPFGTKNKKIRGPPGLTFFAIVLKNPTFEGGFFHIFVDKMNKK